MRGRTSLIVALIVSGILWSDGIAAQETGATPASESESRPEESTGADETARLRKQLQRREDEVEKLRARLGELERELKERTAKLKSDAVEQQILGRKLQDRDLELQRADLPREADAAKREALQADRDALAEAQGAQAQVLRTRRRASTRRAAPPLAPAPPVAPPPVARLPRAAAPSTQAPPPLATPGVPELAPSTLAPAELFPGASTAPSHPSERAVDQLIDRAAALRKQALRAKLRGREEESRRLWLEAEDVRRQIEEHLHSHGSLSPPPPAAPPGPARPARRSERRREQRDGRVAPSTDTAPARPTTPPGVAQPRHRTADSNERIWEEIEELRGDVRELRQLLKKALREKSTHGQSELFGGARAF